MQQTVPSLTMQASRATSAIKVIELSVMVGNVNGCVGMVGV